MAASNTAATRGRFVKRIKRHSALFAINHFFAGTHFFGVKRRLLRFADVEVGEDSKVVGPLFLGGAATLKIGDHVWLGRNAAVDGNGTVKIGDWVDVGPCVSFGTGGHEIAGHDHRAGEGVVASISVGDGSWIGQRTLIINDTAIGRGSVVAAGAVVIGDVPDDVLVAGVPAKVKKQLP